MQLLISSAMLVELQQLALDAAPAETCGILFGEDGKVSGYRAAQNVADDPSRHFEIDPAILIETERDSRNGGKPILGYYHSHPVGPVRPSITDAESAAPDHRIWLILNGRDAAAWRAVEDGEIYSRFDAIVLDCFGANGQTVEE
ncbi:M67 family metallopeptidase [Parasphingorhabdus sp.]|uniref:M67 family metallopeptidase n=1 Tax=Parasphingorhabdus sp. TaxID=2709688 RepID=UPI003264C905